MRKNLKLCSIISFIFIIGIFLLQTSCNSNSGKTLPELKSENLTAHFDYFTYKGDDDFYKENPLPGDDYYYNPILPGWYSDPSVGSNGEDYYMVTSTFAYFPGVPIFHSKDLVNWKQVGHVLDRPEQLPLEGQRTSGGIFAPAISYNPNNQTWYMITTNVGKGNFFVKTKDPQGSWSDPIWLPEVHGIDPSFFFDCDGKAYIVNNDEPDGGSTYQGHRAIRLIEFDVDNDVTVGSSKMIVNGGVNLDEKPIWIEGPHLYKINGKYYLMCAEGGTSVDHREVIFKSDTPTGPFKPAVMNPILTQRQLPNDRPIPITCAGHADLVQKNDGQWWSFFLACRPIDNKFENLGRETFFMPVRWNEKGFPYMTKDDEVIPRMIQMEGVKRDDSLKIFGNFELKDDFTSSALGMQWMNIHGDASALYSLSENAGYLSLKCAEVSSNEAIPSAFVCRRLQHHKFECETSLFLHSTSKSDKAGILLYKDESHQYLLALQELTQDSSLLSVTRIGAEGAAVLSSRVITKSLNPVKLKVTSSGKAFSFQYAIDEEWNMLASNIDAYYLSTAQSYGFTGTTIGLYASSKDY